MNEADIIKGAREILSEPKRWHQGDYVSEDGERVCMLGALGQASERNPRSTLVSFGTPLGRAMDLVQQHLPGRFLDIPAFNDSTETTHADVLTVFDKTLADLGAL